MVNVTVKCLLVLLSIIQIGTCYQCYQCVYVAGITRTLNATLGIFDSIPGFSKQILGRAALDCGDPPTTEPLDKVACAGEDMECAKISATFADDDAPSIIIRGCMPTWTCNIFNECDTCDEELCNSSTNLMPSFAIISLLGLISVRYLF